MMQVNSSKVDWSAEGQQRLKRLGVRRKRRPKAVKSEAVDSKLSESIVFKKKVMKKKKRRTTSQVLPHGTTVVRKLCPAATPHGAAFDTKPRKVSTSIKVKRSSKALADKAPSLARKPRKRAGGSSDGPARPGGEPGRVIAEVEPSSEGVAPVSNWLYRAPPSVVKNMAETTTPSARMHVQNFIKDLQKLQVEHRKALRGSTAA